MSVIDQSLLTERVYRHLLERIITKAFPAGARLAEETISAELEVSRTPVREALRRLNQEGFVIYAPRRGCRVKPLSTQDVEDIFELRCLLEPLALREAMPHIQPDDLAEITHLLDMAPDADAARKHQSALDADDRLHDLFCRRCVNRHLRDFLRHLIGLSRPYRGFGAATPDQTRRLNAERRGILEALCAGQPAQAAKLLAKHIREGKETILSKM